MRVLWLLMLLLVCHAQAHEVRPASMEITALDSGGWEFSWRQPISGEYTLSIAPVLSSGWLDAEPDQRRVTDTGLISVWNVPESDVKLAGQELYIRGLDRTITDVLVTINFSNEEQFTRLIKAADPRMTLPAVGEGAGTIPEYMWLGLEHIWSGPDHLLYVLALMLLIHSVRALVFTLTAFTLAHSITLACAVLGLVSLQSAPVEAVISLSIVYVAVELVRNSQGREGVGFSWPWLIAFLFGLLHGFGFAGALQEIGLPSRAVASALLFFNLGIEVGQLLFVAMAGCGLLLLYRVMPAVYASTRKALPYMIGSMASFWLIQRLMIIIY